MSRLNIFARKNSHKSKRRYTDSGEHTLSILQAKSETDECSYLSIASVHCSFPTNPSSNSAKTSVYLPQYPESKSFAFLKKTDIQHIHPSSKQYSEKSFLYFIFQGLVKKIILPIFPSIQWLNTAYFNTFNIPKSVEYSSFYVKNPNTCDFQLLESVDQLINKTIIFWSSKSLKHIEELCNLYYHLNHESLSEFFFGDRMLINISEMPAKKVHSCYPLLNITEVPLSSFSNSISIVSKKIKILRVHMQQLKIDTLNLHHDYINFFKSRSQYILSTLNNQKSQDFSISSNVANFRRIRIEIIPNENIYIFDSQSAYSELEILQTYVEFIRVDASQRGCQISKIEVDQLFSSVIDIGKTFLILKDQFCELEPSLRHIMSRELESIVLEEELMTNEGNRLEESIYKCKELTEILISLKKLQEIQESRGPFFVDVQVYPDVDPDMRNSLLSDICNKRVDHNARLKSIDISSAISQRRKKNNLDPNKIFTKDLQYQKKRLRPTNNVNVINNRFNVNYLRWFEEFKREKFLQIQKSRNNSNQKEFSIPSSSFCAFDSSTSQRKATNLSNIELNTQDFPSTIYKDYPHNSKHVVSLQNWNLRAKSNQIPLKVIGPCLLVPGPPENTKSYDTRYFVRPQLASHPGEINLFLSEPHLSVV